MFIVDEAFSFIFFLLSLNNCLSRALVVYLSLPISSGLVKSKAILSSYDLINSKCGFKLSETHSDRVIQSIIFLIPFLKLGAKCLSVFFEAYNAYANNKIKHKKTLVVIYN